MVSHRKMQSCSWTGLRARKTSRSKGSAMQCLGVATVRNTGILAQQPFEATNWKQMTGQTPFTKSHGSVMPASRSLEPHDSHLLGSETPAPTTSSVISRSGRTIRSGPRQRSYREEISMERKALSSVFKSSPIQGRAS